MKKNMGSKDKYIRLILAVSIGALYLLGFISGTLALILGGVAVVLLLTSFINFCPLYFPFKINTNKKEVVK
jgi:hypothetical protein